MEISLDAHTLINHSVVRHLGNSAMSMFVCNDLFPYFFFKLINLFIVCVLVSAL